MAKKQKFFTEESAAMLGDWLRDSQIVDLPKPEQDQAEARALKKLLDDYSAAISKGYHLVMHEIASDPVKKNHLNDFRIDTNIIKQMHNAEDASKLLQEHGVLQGVLGISGETMGEMNRIACNLYDQKKYDQACWILQYMLFLNPYVCYLWQELGLCCQALNQWDEAFWAYGVAINCDPHEKETYSLAVKASLDLKDYEKAREFVQGGLDRFQRQLPNQKNEIKEFLEDLKEYIMAHEHGRIENVG